MKLILGFILIILSHNIYSAEVEFFFSWNTDDDNQELILVKEPSRLFGLRVNKALESDSRTREKELLKLSLDKDDGYIAEYYLTLDSLSAYSLEEQVDLLERFVDKGILNAKLDIANVYTQQAENKDEYFVKAYELYKEVSDSFPVALYNMAILAKKSDGIGLGPKQIATLLSKAFNNGYQPALSGLSYYYMNGVEVEWDSSYWSVLEGMNDPIALSNVGWAYYQGKYVKKDIEQSFDLLNKSLKLKETGVVLHNLGMIYWKEYNQLDKAIKYFRDSFRSGYCYSALKLGIIYHSGNQQLAIKYYKKAIECGVPEAKINLSLLLLDSGDIEQGITMLTETAKTENTTAMYNLGLYLIRGKYIDKDFDKGISYLEKAAEKGHKKSLQILIKLSNTPEIKEHWEKLLKESEGTPVLKK